jgi:hypothetical protein
MKLFAKVFGLSAITDRSAPPGIVLSNNFTRKRDSTG